ncbi:hypothetical protein CLU79DRAFT_755953 [Phycomyces nitens]|nr:hypothetical protein CLU79DRAFT_755953 [Phycomyces nitens]
MSIACFHFPIISMSLLPPPPPSYSLLKPPRPQVLVLPRVRLKKDVQIEHDDQLARLNGFRVSFCQRKRFWIDVELLDKIQYRQRNQHRQFHRFRRAEEVRRILKRFKALAIDQVVTDILKVFWNAKTVEACEGNWNFIPTKEFAEYTMHRLIAATLLLDKLQIVLVDTYRDHSKLLKLEHFVSLGLTYMAIVSRLYTLAVTWTKQLEDCYTLLQRWHAAFPSGLKEKEQKVFLSQNNQICGPQTMQEVRLEYARKESQARSTFEDPLHFSSYVAHCSKLPPIALLKKGLEKVENIEMDVDADKEEDEDDCLEDMGEVIQRE